MPADAYRGQQHNVNRQKLALAECRFRKEFSKDEIVDSYEKEAENRVEEYPHRGRILRAPHRFPLHDEINVDGHKQETYKHSAECHAVLFSFAVLHHTPLVFQSVRF